MGWAWSGRDGDRGMGMEGRCWRDGDEKDGGRDRHRRTRMEGYGWGGGCCRKAGAGGMGQAVHRQGQDGWEKGPEQGGRDRRTGQESRSRQEVQEHGDGCAVAAGSHLQVWVTQRDQEASGSVAGEGGAEVPDAARSTTLPQGRPAGPCCRLGPLWLRCPLLSVPAGCHGWGPAAQQPHGALGVRGCVAAAGPDTPGHHRCLAGPLPRWRGLAQPPPVQRPPSVHGAGDGVPPR